MVRLIKPEEVTREPSVPMYHIFKASSCVEHGKKVILTLPSSCERECVEHISKYIDYTGRQGFVALSGMCRKKCWSRLSQHTSIFVWVSQLMALLLLKMLSTHKFLTEKNQIYCMWNHRLQNLTEKSLPDCPGILQELGTGSWQPCCTMGAWGSWHP